MKSSLNFKTRLVRPLRNGQITIPIEFRKELDIGRSTILQVAVIGQELRIRTVKVSPHDAGAAWAQELYKLFAPVRKETRRYAAREVNRDIARAVAAVRRTRAKSRS